MPGALAGDPDTAVRMDGINDTVRVPDDSTLDVGNTFTAEGWIKRSSTSKTHELMNKGFQLVVMGASNGNQVWLRKPNVAAIARTNAAVGAGAYHHIAVTKNGSGAGAVKFYIDGEPVAAVDVSPALVIQDNNTLLTFGTAGSTPVDHDEFAIYDGQGGAQMSDRRPRAWLGTALMTQSVAGAMTLPIDRASPKETSPSSTGAMSGVHNRLVLSTAATPVQTGGDHPRAPEALAEMRRRTGAEHEPERERQHAAPACSALKPCANCRYCVKAKTEPIIAKKTSPTAIEATLKLGSPNRPSGSIGSATLRSHSTKIVPSSAAAAKHPRTSASPQPRELASMIA